MVIYFSGTGNSAYAAKRIAAAVGDSAADLFDRIKNNDCTAMSSDKPWVVVAPTYAWRIPHILTEWLQKTALSGSKSIYFVMTCGGNIGNAGKYLQKLCAAKEMEYRGCFEVVMPENYIALFKTPDKAEALEIIDEAEGKIDRAAEHIKKGEAFPSVKIKITDRLSSGMVNKMFYPMFVHAKKFYATDKCISCGRCAAVCPLGNVSTQDGKPKWGKNCTHCMACICRCPTQAIEYGKHSRGLPRYVCPKD